MLTLHTYGFGGRTSAAYYALGVADNKAKLTNSSTVVEAAFLLGLSTAPLGSNLDLRRIKTYTNVGSSSRFGTLLTGTFQLVPSMTGKHANVSPLDIAWTLYL